jgi:hypothetical protein
MPNKQIQAWINTHQKSKQGIYPYRVAQEICVLFSVPIDVAITNVCVHMREAMREERADKA